MVTTQTQKLKLKGKSIQKIEWKKDEHADGQTDTTDCFTFPANAVGKNGKTGERERNVQDNNETGTGNEILGPY